MPALIVIHGHLDVIAKVDLTLRSFSTYTLFGLGSWVLVLFVPEKKIAIKTNAILSVHLYF